MIAKLGQTKRAVTIELVLVSILAIVFAYTRMPNPVPASTGISVPPLVATPAPVPSWTFSVAPDARHARGKAKVPPHAAQPSFAANPATVPIATKTSPDIGAVPTTVPKEEAIPSPETTSAIAIKPVDGPALETIPEPAAPVPANKETLVTVPVLVPKDALAMAPDTASSPTPKELPASVLLPAQTVPSQASTSTPAETTQTTTMVGGTAAALIFAPIAAPVSIILGIAVGLFEPSSSQLGQSKSVPTKPTNKPAAGNTTPSSDSTY